MLISTSLFTTFHGRIGRLQWWVGAAVLFALSLATSYLIDPEIYNLSSRGREATFSASLLVLFWAVPWIAITLKRLNDRDQPRWIGYAVAGAIILFPAAQLAGVDVVSLVGVDSDLRAIGIVMLVLAVVLRVWVDIANGFLKGTNGPNRHGPDPLLSGNPPPPTSVPGESSRRSRGATVRDVAVGVVAFAVALSLATSAMAGSFEDGSAALERGDFAEAAMLYRQAAEEGGAAAQFSLGGMYRQGRGVSEDYAEAIKWYRLAADQGHARAQFNLGNMYREGRGVTVDYAEAMNWYRLSAEQGDAKAQFNLSRMYSNGDGVPQDFAEAAIWTRLAAGQDHPGAQNTLGVMYANGNGAPQNDSEAVKWYRLAADQGDADAQYNLGFMYASGRGVPQDDAEAAKWFLPAAEQGDAAAQFGLGVMYRQGRGVPQGDTEAAKWYRLAAEQGDAKAQFNSGLMYASGEGVPQDDVEAAKWFRLAAEQGDARAQYHLGVMYAEGQGVPHDYVQAHIWHNLSAAQGIEEASKNRDIAASRMTPADLSEAQRLAREWKPKTE